jgi:hypothetical protein
MFMYSETLSKLDAPFDPKEVTWYPDPTRTMERVQKDTYRCPVQPRFWRLGLPTSQHLRFIRRYYLGGRSTCFDEPVINRGDIGHIRRS